MPAAQLRGADPRSSKKHNVLDTTSSSRDEPAAEPDAAQSPFITSGAELDEVASTRVARLLADLAMSPPPVYPPPPSPSPSPSPAPVEVTNAPVCSQAAGCFKVNATTGTAFDSFLLTASGWAPGTTHFSGLLYEYGVAEPSGNSLNYKTPTKFSSNSTTATMAGLSVSNATLLYVCVRADNKGNPVGPRACSTVTVKVTAQVSTQQVASVMSGLVSRFTATTTTTSSGSGSSTTASNSTATTPIVTNTAEALQMTQQLSAVLAVTSANKNTSASDSAAIASAVQSVASNLLGSLVASITLDSPSNSSTSGSSNSTSSSSTASTAQVLEVFNGVGTLWSMAGDSGRSAVVTGVSALAEKLADKPVEPEEAQAVVDLFTSMLDDSVSLVDAATSAATVNVTTTTTTSSNGNSGNSKGNSGNSNGNSNGNSGNSNSNSAASKAEAAAAAAAAAAVAAARKEAATKVLASVTKGAAALTKGLLNAAPANGSAVTVVTARLAAAVQRATAALASAGVAMSLNQPGSSSNSTGRTGRRRLLATSSPATAALNPAVGGLCSADANCGAFGMGLTITVFSDVSLLRSALGGSLVPLTGYLWDYKLNGSVEVISPIVRVAAPGIPSTALYGNLTSLVVLDLPINMTAVSLNGGNTRRALVRLQDFGAAPVDASAGVTATTSHTRTFAVDATASQDLVSGYSDALGDFVVVQFSSVMVTPTPSPSPLPSPSPSPSPSASPLPTNSSPSPSVAPQPESGTTGAAGPATAPSAMLVTGLLGLATLLAVVLL